MPIAAEEFRARYGPCALVAGAAVGLGAAYARQIAARGVDLVMLDRDPVPLAATAAAVRREHGVEVQELVAELGHPNVVTRVGNALGQREVGLLVYNAALGTVAPFLELDPAHLDAMLAVNCRAPVQLVRALAPAMVARRRGGIVLMSSMSGNVGSAQLAMYAASKAFALVLGDALWVELRAHGVDVLVVQPGSTRTPGWESSQPADGTTLPVMEADDVVREALEALGVEPLIIPGEMNRQGAAGIAQLSRRQAIEFMSQFTAGLVRNDRTKD
ncbi:MAG TPA: SDR family NAD(P)-dependent oxidoreductase [Candidatus Dormibacteraeota bacterium]|nr:SDR family NAD(P)-dependent oxidoreductase [Candidatus Dormibacteraeota bacterium]